MTQRSDPRQAGWDEPGTRRGSDEPDMRRGRYDPGPYDAGSARPGPYDDGPYDDEPERRGRGGVAAGVVFLALSLIGSVAFALYAVTVRESSQIPLLAAGAVVLGIVFLVLALFTIRATWRAGVDGRNGQALVLGLRWRDRGDRRVRMHRRGDHPVPVVAGRLSSDPVAG